MKFDVSILSTNEYLAEELIMEEIPEKYLYNEKGDFLYTATIFDSENTIRHFIGFLFEGNEPSNEVYRDKNTYVLDLSNKRKNLLSFEKLEKLAMNWIEITGRENTMNEYGMLIDFIGHILKGADKKYLLMIVSNERFENSL